MPFAKIVLLALIAPMLWGALYVFDAASTTSLALELAQSAQATESKVVRAKLLTSAEQAIENGWSEPDQWHAGAAEVLSGVYLFQAQEQDNAGDHLLQSTAFAERTVRLAPVQPHAWTRLAALEQRGQKVAACDERTCLENSWRTAPMIDRGTACLRLQLAARQNMLIPDDPRVEAYVRSRISARETATCLSTFMSRDQLFHALLKRAK